MSGGRRSTRRRCDGSAACLDEVRHQQEEHFDMSTLHEARKGFAILGSLALSIGLLLGVPGTAAAGGGAYSGVADFCTDYDNTEPTQLSGQFTDVRRGAGISADGNCVLNLSGSVGSAGDMWITLLGAPGGSPPTLKCWALEAEVLIKRFDNRKGVGFVTNYAGGMGLFFGLYDNGNSDGLTLSTFDTATGKLLSTVKTVFLGSKVKENAWYPLALDICTHNGGTWLSAHGVVELAPGEWTPLDFEGPTPPGIAAYGAAGIAGQAKSSFVDSSVRDFGFCGENYECECFDNPS
jgi:hypothetical protein